MNSEAFSLVLEVMNKYSRGELKDQRLIANGKYQLIIQCVQCHVHNSALIGSRKNEVKQHHLEAIQNLDPPSQIATLHISLGEMRSECKRYKEMKTAKQLFMK